MDYPSYITTSLFDGFSDVRTVNVHYPSAIPGAPVVQADFAEFVCEVKLSHGSDKSDCDQITQFLRAKFALVGDPRCQPEVYVITLMRWKVFPDVSLPPMRVEVSPGFRFNNEDQVWATFTPKPVSNTQQWVLDTDDVQ